MVYNGDMSDPNLSRPVVTDKYPEDFNNNIQSHKESKGSQKLWNYFLEITKKDYYKNLIVELREKYKIPKDGFKPDKDGFCHFPPLNSILYNNTAEENELRNEIIEKICKKYQLRWFDFSDVIMGYLFYNELSRLEDWGLYELCWIQNIVDEKKHPFEPSTQQDFDSAFPIAIRISPYASQRDIIDYIKNKENWEIISANQKQYKDPNTKIGKVKSKKQSIQERNNLIFENKDKPLKEIRELLTDKDIFLDDGHISKIISLEKQTRKEV